MAEKTMGHQEESQDNLIYPELPQRTKKAICRQQSTKLLKVRLC